MLRVEFFLDTANGEQSKIIEELAPFNERARAEVIRHAFVAVNVFDIDISYQKALYQADIVRDDSFNKDDFETSRYEKVALIWRARAIPRSLANVLREVQSLSKRARYQYLLAVFIIGNRIINGEFKQPAIRTSSRPISSSALNANDNVPTTEQTPVDKLSETSHIPESDPKDVKEALGQLMKRNG